MTPNGIRVLGGYVDEVFLPDNGGDVTWTNEYARAKEAVAVTWTNEYARAKEALAAVDALYQAATIALGYLTDSPAMVGKSDEVRIKAAVAHLAAAVRRVEGA